jgi:hypothetical protein
VAAASAGGDSTQAAPAEEQSRHLPVEGQCLNGVIAEINVEDFTGPAVHDDLAPILPGDFVAAGRVQSILTS